MPSLRLKPPALRPGVVSRLAVLVVTAALAPATLARADDSGWPRQVDSSSGQIVIYQPQAEDLNGDELSSRAAFSLQRSGATSPTFGVLWFTEHVDIDRDSSTVSARSLDVTKVRLPGITAAEASRYEKIIESEATQWDLSGSLEELQAELAATEKERASVADLSHDPPRIVFASERAFLVAYDGMPTLEPIEGSKLERVANTPYAVVFDPTSLDYYLNGANLWYRARDPLGPWTAIHEAPSVVRAVVPPDTSSDDQIWTSPPLVITATEPTELIWSDGPPRYAPLVRDELLYVTNTECDVIREVSTQAMYVLLAGRWYRASSSDGPWTFVRGDQLPASFKEIPADSPKGNLLASVAGTDQAEDAIADAEIPQTSAIRRDASDFQVSCDGSPQFEPIEGTNMQYAVNTDAEVIYADGRYYACDQGVWYIADDPEGPWRVSETRPLEVDDIPPTCPVYNVRYVYVFDTTPDVIYMGYLPGYVGCYPYYGTVVFGTGHHYHPWRGRRHFFPRPATWGFYPRYNPWLSRWSFGFSYNSGFLRIGARWRSWGRPAEHRNRPLWFGPGGYRRPLLSGDLTLRRTRRPNVQRPGLPDRTPANLYNRPENVVRVDRTALRMPVGRSGPVVRPVRLPNNVFAGKDGKVYQRDERGNWKVNEGRTWRPTRVPVTPPGSTPAAGGGAAGGGTRVMDRPAERPLPRPMPQERSPEPEMRPRRFPSAHPSAPPEPPPISPTPGNLERDFRARERAGDKAPPDVSKPPAQPAPARPESPQRSERTERTERPTKKPPAERQP